MIYVIKVGVVLGVNSWVYVGCLIFAARARFEICLDLRCFIKVITLLHLKLGSNSLLESIEFLFLVRCFC